MVGQKQEVESEQCCQSYRRVSSPSLPSAVLVVELKAIKIFIKTYRNKSRTPNLSKYYDFKNLLLVWFCAIKELTLGKSWWLVCFFIEEPIASPESSELISHKTHKGWPQHSSLQRPLRHCPDEQIHLVHWRVHLSQLVYTLNRHFTISLNFTFG